MQLAKIGLMVGFSTQAGFTFPTNAKNMIKLNYLGETRFNELNCRYLFQGSRLMMTKTVISY